MAGRGVSPGAALLRSSRMFSMPSPIPTPPSDYSSATKHYSPTATISYPTHLTVTTTSSSRINGDWGFKRPFPLKTTTNTTYPLIRVKQVDSTEHVTDFQSASDHTITLQKYQELNMPISVPGPKDSAAKPDLKSVFEESGDVTALDAEQKAELANKRWKFTGPWLAGMTDGDFDRFIEKEVRGRRSEFRAFLRKNLAAEMTADQAQKAREARESEPPTVSASDVTDEDFMVYLRDLRQDRMTLYALVGRFLDLAPIDLDTTLKFLGTLAPNQPRDIDRASPYGAYGPPITHPSAGLSYLRTRNFQENHPLYGPQRHHPPVKARILKPTHFPTGTFRASIGLAGFVVNPLVTNGVFNATRAWNQSKLTSALHNIELEERGGSKLYVQPTQATVDSSGRICIQIDEANPESEVVQKEMVGEASVFDQMLKKSETPEVPINQRHPGFSARMGTRPRGLRRDGNAQNYGL
ncbi:mitochondrial ribosomal protein MRP51 [Hypoxylon sp. FL1150]|nr:mitochondrial ribosomal protein MRP51 [Hypoxylon sp. FL1150]